MDELFRRVTPLRNPLLLNWCRSGVAGAVLVSALLPELQAAGVASGSGVSPGPVEILTIPGVLGPERLELLRDGSFLGLTSQAARRPGSVRARRVGENPDGAPSHVVTRKVAVLLDETGDPYRLESVAGVGPAVPVEAVPGAWVFEAADSGEESLRLAARLASEPGVMAAWPVLESPRVARTLPNDPYLVRQWTLNNTGQSRGVRGADAGVFAAWDSGYTGAGVLVAVVDDGFELGHPDLGANLRVDLGWDYRSDDPKPEAEGLDGFGEDGRPRADSHGTSVAGIIAAVANNAFGVVGIAYGSRVVPIRALERGMTDLTEASALGHRAVEVSISNNSWGPDDDAKTISSPGILAEKARENGVRDGRGGRGIVYVWAGGNGAEQEDDANYDGYANSIYVIAAGALSDRGERCTYSEKGACIAVTAPSGNDAVRKPGTWTTDLIGNRGYNGTSTPDDLTDNRFTAAFNGTSAAAPVVSAVAALMLEANPRLGWRDVKEILMRTASFTDPGHAGWVTNAVGMRFNHDYGAGRVNAGAAVQQALHWTNLPPMARIARSKLSRELIPIPDGDPAGVTYVFHFDEQFRVEHVRLRTAIHHMARGELQLELISPGGTLSRLWSPHADSNAGLEHRFSSVACWGEPASGDWILRVTDFVPGVFGDISTLELELFGSFPDPEVRLSAVREAEGGIRIQLTGRAGAAGRLERTTDLKGWIDLGAVALPGGAAEALDPSPPAEAAWYRWVSE